MHRGSSGNTEGGRGTGDNNGSFQGWKDGGGLSREEVAEAGSETGP